MSLREKVSGVRNAVVANMSRVVKSDGNTRYIKNGKDGYKVETTKDYKEGVEFGVVNISNQTTVANVDYLSFNVTDNNGKSQKVTIERRNIVKKGIGPFARCPECIAYAENNGLNCLELENDTDINDINSVRYQLGKASKEGNDTVRDRARRLVHFIDKFVIVTPEERKAYREYATKMDKLERDVQRARKKKENAQQKAKEKQARKNAEAAVAKGAAKIEAGKNFFGR